MIFLRLQIRNIDKVGQHLSEIKFYITFHGPFWRIHLPQRKFEMITDNRKGRHSIYLLHYTSYLINLVNLTNEHLTGLKCC